MAFITYGHHSLIQGNRKDAILGTLLSIVLAIIFTCLQYYEYSEAAFTISDSIYGTTFYASTGLHGLTLAPTKTFIHVFKSKKIHNTRKFNDICQHFSYKQEDNTFLSGNHQKDKLFINLNSTGKNIFYLERPFLEWLVGFTDAEGNFNISLRNFKDNKYNSLVLTYQIGLHIDDLNLLKFIKNKLQCGHISVSGNKCNYFVNDRISLIQVILPIFKFFQLNSSKHFQFLIFEKAVKLIKNKNHLSSEGKLEIIKYYHEIKKESVCLSSSISITDYWLGGFVDGDGCFSCSNFGPRFKFENHIKELELLKKIKEYLNSGILSITKPRKNRINSNPTCILDLNNIHVLKNVIIPTLKDCEFQKLHPLCQKIKDFNDWCILVNIFYNGYHRLAEGVALINEIRSNWNKFRLSTSNNKQDKTCFQTIDLAPAPALTGQVQGPFVGEKQLNDLFSLPAPYEIKNGVRFLRGTNKLVSEKAHILCIDQNNNKLNFSSISECSKALKIDRSTIKKYLMTGEIIRNYKFILTP